MQWFRKSKPEEELFDTFSDPHELRNLAREPNFKKKLICLFLNLSFQAPHLALQEPEQG